ncbi:MAG: hypothetical protein P8Z30_02625 [Acidobacteriota bacterium]
MKQAISGKEAQTDLFGGTTPAGTPLWQLEIAELAGHNIETKGRDEVNRLLSEGWILLHIYTLRYEESGVWRERPMAILGRPRNPVNASERKRRRAS